MAQPIQVSQGLPEGGYSVIDNSAPGNFLVSTLTAGAPGYDTTWPGAIAQFTNKFTNGTIPDCVAYGTTTIKSSPAGLATTIFKNPA